MCFPWNFGQEEICRVSKISPKLQKLLLGEAILQNCDRLREVLHSEAPRVSGGGFFSEVGDVGW